MATKKDKKPKVSAPVAPPAKKQQAKALVDQQGGEDESAEDATRSKGKAEPTRKK